MSGVTSSIWIGPRRFRSTLSRPGRALLEHVLEVAEPVFDPLDWRRSEDLLPTAAQAINLGGERFHPPLGFDPIAD